MGALEDKENAISREPVTLVILTMDYCQNSFGVAPCTATGTPCYNTFPTCRDIPNYSAGTKDYKFTNREGAIPGARPYLVQASDLPTKIAKTLAVKGRLKVTLADELDDDTGFDPYVTQRAAFPDIPGTWAKKWLERNYNFRGRRVRRYDGYMGVDEAEYRQTWEGKIEEINPTGTGLSVEAVDLLGDLDKIKVPAKIDCKLVAEITDTDNIATLTSVEDIPDSGYLVMGKELIKYTAKNGTTNQITGMTRGEEGTTATTHNKNEKVGLVRHYSGNPFDILKDDMLTTDGSVAASFIDSDEWSYWRDYPETEISMEAFIVKPTSLRDLYFELVEHCLAQSWVGEDLMITIRRDVPNEPGRSYRDLTGRANFSNPAMPVDWNDKERKSRYVLYWDRRDLFADDEDEAAYLTRDIGIHADVESTNDLGGPDEETVYSRWVRTGTATEEELETYARNLASRRVLQLKDPRPIITATLDRKDQGIKTGEWVRVSTNALLNKDGTPLERQKFQVVERKMQGSKVETKLKRTSQDLFLCIAPDSLEGVDWENATESEKEYGCIAYDNAVNSDEGGGRIF